jgi:hypothetical protein
MDAMIARLEAAFSNTLTSYGADVLDGKIVEIHVTAETIAYHWSSDKILQISYDILQAGCEFLFDLIHTNTLPFAKVNVKEAVRMAFVPQNSKAQGCQAPNFVVLPVEAHPIYGVV